MILRFREDERDSVHCRVTVFSGYDLGPDRTTLGNSGQLVLDTDVWDTLKAALPTYIASRAEGILHLDRSPA